MSDYGCPDCFKDGRSLRDKFHQTRFDAQKFSDENNIKVAIIQEAQGFKYESFETQTPSGTVEVIVPSK